MTELERYFAGVVEPTIADFEAEPTSVRRAFLACVALFHSVDYLAWRKASSRSYRERWKRDCPSFGLVDDVAHAFKHVAVRDGRGLHSADVLRRPPALADEMECGVSCLGDELGGVTLAGDLDVDLMQAVRTAAKFIQVQMSPERPA